LTRDFIRLLLLLLDFGCVCVAELWSLVFFLGDGVLEFFLLEPQLVFAFLFRHVEFVGDCADFFFDVVCFRRYFLSANSPEDDLEGFFLFLAASIFL
jgi:hypothetical protein